MAQSFFDKLRDEFDEMRYRMEQRRRKAWEAAEAAEEPKTAEDQAFQEEKEKDRLRRERDPVAYDLIVGSRKFHVFCLCLLGIYLYWWFHDRVLEGNIFKR